MIIKNALCEYIYQKSSINKEEVSKYLIDKEWEFHDIKSTIKSISHEKQQILKNKSDLLTINTIEDIYQHAKVININNNTVAIKVKYRDFQEIFIYNKLYAGVHIKCQDYSRGGIRISKRLDYLKEATELAISQNKKNISIVPGGGKGCIYIFDDFNKVEEIYKNYIYSLINLDDKVLVAPDVGTADFSDIANTIAIDNSHWARDAFAAGGNINGVSHKKIGITSKGGLEVRKTYYSGLETYTAIGIGDMSGDVFGNYFALDNNVLLLAAFNHEYVFIDPKPDKNISFEERKRLFHMQKSSWEDYSKLSSGGRIYRRKDKKVELTDAIRNLIKFKERYIDIDILIKRILCLQVDVIVSGGVGTYIVDDNDNVDLENSSLQCLAIDIRARNIIEMGNLTITTNALKQLKSFTLSSKIDSAAGVICSDYEVNIKLIKHGLKIGFYTKFIEEAVLLQMYHKAMTIQADMLDRIEDKYQSIDKYVSILSELQENIKQQLDKLRNTKKVAIAYFPEELHSTCYDNIITHKFFNDLIIINISNMIVYTIGLSNVIKLCEKVSLTSLCQFIIDNYDELLSFISQKTYDIKHYKEEQNKHYLDCLAYIAENTIDY